MEGRVVEEKNRSILKPGRACVRVVVHSSSVLSTLLIKIHENFRQH